MTHHRNGRLVLLCAFTASAFSIAGGGDAPARAQQGTESPQTILPPGLYLFQTRTRDGTCDDAPRTGYVTSAIATLDGVPGARTMTMQLLNSKYWPTWTLTISTDDTIRGSAFMNGAKDDSAGGSTFELREKKERYQGTGSRNYNAKVGGKPARCTLNYDALLKPLTN